MSDENRNQETETPSADERRLRELFSSLKKVEAPKDFDLRLKARLANARAEDFRPRFGWALRFALPALAVVLALGLFVFSGRLTSNDATVASAGNSSPAAERPLPANFAASVPTPVETPETPDLKASLPTDQDSPKPPEREVAQTRPAATPVRKIKRDGADREAPLSEDKASKLTPVFQPNPAPKPVPTVEVRETPNPLTVRDVLSTIGIDAAFENGRWTVRSITANGVGESSGVRENDVVEAIDDEPLNGETVFYKTAAGRTLTVTRGGGKLKIRLRNKQ
ncbi:MAG: hypothetical protein JSS81_06120 [Acidobacteria bacterium]|nr:hypothetical protein [Acidobacteriota bacterium]